MSLRAFALAIVVAAPIAVAHAQAPAAAPPLQRYIAGKLPLEDNLVIEQLGADGKATEIFRGGAPTSWHWFDAHTLLELFDDSTRGDVTIAAIVDGKPEPQRAIKIDNTTWPTEAQGWSQYLAVHQRQLWLVREPPRAPPKPTVKPRGRAKAAPPAAPVKPVYQRIDVTPHVLQREPPAGGVAASETGRAWVDSLPSVPPPRTLAVTRAKARVGRRVVGTLRCKPAKGAITTFPTQATPPLLRFDVGAVRFVSPTLPLYIASGMTTDRPGGPAFDTAAFLGCTKEPLHTVAWGGGDVFMTIAGAPGGAGFSAEDHRQMQLWVDGRTVANLGVLIDPALSPP